MGRSKIELLCGTDALVDHNAPAPQHHSPLCLSHFAQIFAFTFLFVITHRIPFSLRLLHDQLITEFTRYYKIGVGCQKFVKCQVMPSQLLIGSNFPPRDLENHEKRKIKTSIQYKNLSKITSNNSPSRFNNSLKNFGETPNACHLLYQLSFYKTS